MKKSLVLVLAFVLAITCLFAGCGNSEPEAKVAGVPEEPAAAKNKVDVTQKEGKKYTTIEFGRYPSKELDSKKDADLIEKLGGLSDDKKDSVTGYYTYEDKLYQKEIKIVKDEEGVDTEELHWFEVEPIKWIVLEESDGKMLVMAEQNVMAMPYNSVPEDTNWAVSTLRDWLNNLNDYKGKINFYNSAFNEDEKAVIKTQEIKTEANSRYKDVASGEDVKDRVTLLSISDLDNEEFANGLFEADKEEMTFGKAAGNTEYAIFKGVVAASSYEESNSSWYWLRNIGRDAQNAALVNELGDVILEGYTVSFPRIGVRPVILLDANNLNIK